MSGGVLMDTNCDAPHYRIVQACRRIGFQSPEDVCWCRMRHFRTWHPGWREFVRRPLKVLSRLTQTARTCFCGQSIPRLQKYVFTFESGREESYFIGQCDQCRTIFWEEGEGVPSIPD